MGFQFNQVGGGTKTRRPIALRMQYNPDCHHPKCFLQGDDGVERPKSLSEIQEYIEKENKRLERDPVRCFDEREINVRMEYKYCPNMILIDTPGLIAAPKIPRGRAGSNSGVSMQQRALLKSAREAERLVVNKMKCQDYIILCVEDTMDWKHGATREIVQKADPDLQRTVIINTKLDTKIPQFGTPADVSDFLRAEVIDNLSPNKLGGPFFSSVPSGRVGRPEDSRDGSFDDFMYGDDEDFVHACMENEEKDRDVIKQRLKNLKFRNNDVQSPISAAKTLLPRVGLSRLRGFLERRVDECYRRNVAKIVPMLQSEQEQCKRKLEQCDKDIEAISVERLKQGADAFCDDFCHALKQSIQGSIIAPPTIYGETLEQEVNNAGNFFGKFFMVRLPTIYIISSFLTPFLSHLDINGCPMSISDRTYNMLVETEVGNHAHRLYGGAQYHRVMREFNLATRCLRLPTISEDEIANAAGMGETHDGVNFLRAASIISLEKARCSFDPLLNALRIRMSHTMSRLCPIAEFMLNHKRERDSNIYSTADLFGTMDHPRDGKGPDITQNAQFLSLVRTIYDKFVNECTHQTMMRCHDDLQALTKFVTWDIHERSAGALQRSLPDQTDIVEIYQVAVKAAELDKESKAELGDDEDSETEVRKITKTVTKPKASKGELKASNHVDRDYKNLLQLMEEAACSRNNGRTDMLIGGLVQHIVTGWRETFTRSVTTKFNCYFLLPFVDDFHKYLRRELQSVYDGNSEALGDVFDLKAARRSLHQRRSELQKEMNANLRLQDKFAQVSKQMREEQERDEVEA